MKLSVLRRHGSHGTDVYFPGFRIVVTISEGFCGDVKYCHVDCHNADLFGYLLFGVYASGNLIIIIGDKEWVDIFYAHDC